MNTSEVGLLELLAARLGCVYLSDLRQPQLWPAIQMILKDIVPEQFSLWEWNDAVTYFTGEKSQKFQKQLQAKTYLLHYRAESYER